MISISDIHGAGLQAPTQTSNRGELGQDDFLTLMITQFRNQDPFEPMDNGDFLGQLAQFSTVNGIDSLNSSFSGLSGALRDEQALQAANLVGRKVLAVNDTGYFGGGSPMNVAVELGSAASNVQLEITDVNGQLVRRIDVGEQAPGTVRIEWDGRNQDGELMAAGDYKVVARVIRGISYESVPTLIESSIESVTLGHFGGGMTLNTTGGGTLALAQVYQIT